MAASKTSRRRRQYASLQPRTLDVSQSAIRKKWTNLPENSQLRVRQLFRSIERSVQHSDGGTVTQVQSVVRDMASMLTRKVPRMPFPPRTEESFFDYETTLNRTHILEVQLTADVHSTNLLKTEIEKERRLLEEDKNELQHLERALRDGEARRQRHNKGLHPLAKDLGQTTCRPRITYDKGVTPCKRTEPRFRDLENDASLEALLQQVHSHLESMQNNTASIAEIPLAITDSQAALDSFTWRNLDKESYGKLHGLDLT